MNDRSQLIFESMVKIENIAKEYARIDREVFHRGFWKGLFSAIDFNMYHATSERLLSEVKMAIKEMGDDSPMLLLAQMCSTAIEDMHNLILLLKEKANGKGGLQYGNYDTAYKKFMTSRDAFIKSWNRK